MTDGRLEVMGVAGTLHIGLCELFCDSAMRLAQPRRVTVRVRGAGVPMQVDGEPFRFGPGTVTIEHAGHYPLLRRPPPSRLAFPSAASPDRDGFAA